MKRKKIRRSGSLALRLIMFSTIVCICLVAVTSWAVAPPPFTKFQKLTSINTKEANIDRIRFVSFNAKAKDSGKTIKFSGRIKINNFNGDVNKYLRDNKLRLIPVVFYKAYYTYFAVNVASDGSFKGHWPIKSTHGRDFWVALFKTNGPVKPVQEPTAPDNLHQEMYAASQAKTF